MSKDFYQELAKDFPAEAMTKDTSRGFALTSIKAQYVRERLNEVMGVEGWDSTTEVVHISDEGAVAVKFALTLHFPERSVTRTAFGGAKAKDKGQTYGDIFKSAETDALSKAASNFGVGNAVFKGLVDANNLGESSKSAAKKATSSSKPKDSFNRRKKVETVEEVGDDI